MKTETSTVERLEFITDEEYSEVLRFLHKYLNDLEVQSETPGIAGLLTQGRKAILIELNSLRSDPSRQTRTYGWRPVIIDFISRVADKLEYSRFYSECAMIRSFYNVIEKKVVEIVVNNKLADISKVAHQDYLNERRGGIRK